MFHHKTYGTISVLHLKSYEKKPLEIKLVKGHTNYQIRITLKDILNRKKQNRFFLLPKT